MPVIAAIDIGSNAIRMVIAETKAQAGYTLLDSQREPLRLGRDVFSEGRISDKTLEQAIELFVRFRKKLDSFKVKTYRAVATSALREAFNQKDVVRAIAKRSGIDISIIQGEEEARLVSAAVTRQIALEGKLALLVDIGGGSVELTVINDGDVIMCDSVTMGTVRLLQVLEEKKRGREIFNRLVNQYAEGVKRQLTKDLGKRKVDLLVGTGGNVEALGDLRRSYLKQSESDRITSKELEEIAKNLQSLTYEERIEHRGLKPDRADVIIPACILLQKVVQQAGASELVIPRVGLKEGVLWDIIEELHGGRSVGTRRKQVFHFALELGQRFGFDELHGRRVASLAVDLFDQTAKLHGLGDRERLLLEIAALLHDVGQCISMGGHHKHSYYILRSTHFVGLTRKERELVAVVARYHRKAYPKMAHAEFAGLSEADRTAVEKLAPLLRIAEALDREHTGKVTAVSLECKKTKVEITLTGQSDMLLERWAIMARASMFERVFDRKIVINN